jgi:hypothetical protein
MPVRRVGIEFPAGQPEEPRSGLLVEQLRND